MLWYFEFDFYFCSFRLWPFRLIPCPTLLPNSTLSWVCWFLHSWVSPPHSSLKTLEFREQIRDHWGFTWAFKNMHFICNKIVSNIKSIDCTWLLRNIQKTSLSRNIEIISCHQRDVGFSQGTVLCSGYHPIPHLSMRVYTLHPGWLVWSFL